MLRKIPATMATQHPDNAFPPFWEKDGDGFVSTHEEVRECYAAFHDLGCQEFMWDWEGKYVDEAVVDKLFHAYHAYFRRQQLGRDRFLTFRIPNIWRERGYGLARALMGILTAETFARDLRLHTPPLFEVILPMTHRASDIITIQRNFAQLATLKRRLFRDRGTLQYLHVLPLIEGIDDLVACRQLLERYLVLHRREFRQLPASLRLHIARSDPALNAGLIAAVVAGKVALSEFYRFSREHELPVYPAIGVGSLPFRGGLTPERIGDFLREYPGMRTVYIQSAFRYDFPLPAVKRGIRQLNARLPKSAPRVWSVRQVAQAGDVCRLAAPWYRRTVERLAVTINEIAHAVPSRRERKLHVGLFGYSRGVGRTKLPRAIPFTAALYSLGVPPEFIGTGRTLKQLARHRLNVEEFYRNLRADLRWAGGYLNRENLALLAKRSSAWAAVGEDVRLVEEFLGEELGPRTVNQYLHRNAASNVYYLWRAGRPFSNQIIEAGKLRRSLG